MEDALTSLSPLHFEISNGNHILSLLHSKTNIQFTIKLAEELTQHRVARGDGHGCHVWMESYICILIDAKEPHYNLLTHLLTSYTLKQGISHKHYPSSDLIDKMARNCNQTWLCGWQERKPKLDIVCFIWKSHFLIYRTCGILPTVLKNDNTILLVSLLLLKFSQNIVLNMKVDKWTTVWNTLSQKPW